MPPFITKVPVGHADITRRREPNEFWMSGQAADVAKDKYTNGPASRNVILSQLEGKDGEVVVGKRADGSIISVEQVVNGNLTKVVSGQWPFPGTPFDVTQVSPTSTGETVKSVLEELTKRVFGDGADVYSGGFDDLYDLLCKVRTVQRGSRGPDEEDYFTVLEELADSVFGSCVGDEPDVYADEGFNLLKSRAEAALAGEPLPSNAAALSR